LKLIGKEEITGLFRLQTYSHLIKLTLIDIPLRPDELKDLLVLPALAYLKVGDTYSAAKVTLFQQSSYPTIEKNLSPLKELDISESDIRFTELKVKLLLQRFGNTLQRVRLGEISMTKKAFVQLKSQWKYQLEIFTYTSKAKPHTSHRGQGQLLQDSESTCNVS